MKEGRLTSLGDDGSGGNNDDGPVELALEVADDLLGYLAKGVEGPVRDLDEKNLGSVAVSLVVFSQFSTVDVELGEVFFQIGIVHFEVENTLCYFVLQVSGLALKAQITPFSALRRLSL